MAKKKDLEEKRKCGENCKCDENCNCGCQTEEKTCTCGCHEKDNNEYLEMAQRLQAEFDNYRKRSADIVKNARIDGIAECANKILPALDSFEKAKAMITDEKVLAGVEMIENSFKQSLKTLEIEEIEVLGLPLDPNNANVVAIICDNSLEDGVVAQVYQAGYKIKDRVLRYAQVVVNKLN